MAKIDRSKDQEEKANMWLDGDRFNTLLLGTGYGKSRTSMIVLEKLFGTNTLTKNSKILILSNSEKLRDTNWKEDFEKWNFSWIWDIAESECYQTVYKWKDTKWDLVIADEIDFSLTEKYCAFFSNNKMSMLLGLTGYVDDSKRGLLEFIAPVLVEYSTQDAQRDGLLNKTQFTFISFDLSQNKSDITVKYKKNGKEMSFTQSENDAYSYAETQCGMLFHKERELVEAVAKTAGLDDDINKRLNATRGKLRKAYTTRKEILLNGVASAKTAKDLISLLLKHPDNKIVTFSMLTDQADKINGITYHGKNKKENADVLEQLSGGDIRSLGVCKAINRGVNINGLNSLIRESYDSSTTAQAQIHGRGTRLGADQTMNMYILLPYYLKKVKSPDKHGGYTYVRKPTQAIVWARNMLSDSEVINPIMIRKGTGENDWTRDTTTT